MTIPSAPITTGITVTFKCFIIIIIIIISFPLKTHSGFNWKTGRKLIEKRTSNNITEREREREREKTYFIKVKKFHRYAFKTKIPSTLSFSRGSFLYSTFFSCFIFALPVQLFWFSRVFIFINFFFILLFFYFRSFSFVLYFHSFYCCNWFTFFDDIAHFFKRFLLDFRLLSVIFLFLIILGYL